MTGALLEEEWERLGLTVLSSDADRTLVLFASSEDMRDFRARLDAYQGGPPPGQKHAPYVNFVSGIESIGSVEPRDRIGPRLRKKVSLMSRILSRRHPIWWTSSFGIWANVASASASLRMSSATSRHEVAMSLIAMSAPRSACFARA
ncbi:hypothetical protein CWS35_37195 (plasmid) [Bradyrhizobium sp. SK17]|nr:hypothetical protein CWS35_37195 [Bradyrhizobium sp. SK17]